MTRSDIENCVLDVLRAMFAELNRPAPPDLGPDTRLFGGPEGLDSVMLVTCLADLEAKVAERFGKEIVLADERAVSARASPFRRVGTLTDLLAERLREAGATLDADA